MKSNYTLLPIDKKFVKLQYAVSIYNTDNKTLRIIDNIYYLDKKLYQYLQKNNYNIIDPEVECNLNVKEYESIDAVNYTLKKYKKHSSEILSFHKIKNQQIYINIDKNYDLTCKMLFS